MQFFYLIINFTQICEVGGGAGGVLATWLKMVTNFFKNKTFIQPMRRFLKNIEGGPIKVAPSKQKNLKLWVYHLTNY
jgi:hypothetical protein